MPGSATYPRTCRGHLHRGHGSPERVGGWLAFPPGCADCGRPNGADYYVPDEYGGDDGRWVCEHCWLMVQEIEAGVRAAQEDDGE